MSSDVACIAHVRSYLKFLFVTVENHFDYPRVLVICDIVLVERIWLLVFEVKRKVVTLQKRGEIKEKLTIFIWHEKTIPNLSSFGTVGSTKKISLMSKWRSLSIICLISSQSTLQTMTFKSVKTRFLSSLTMTQFLNCSA